MGFRCPVEKHAEKGLMVQMFQNGILKLNHLLLDELFKWAGGGKGSHVVLKCCWKGNVFLSTCVKALRRKGH
jgi:hypothetical protein